MIKLYNINSIISNNTDNDVLENVSYTVKLKFNDNVINCVRRKPNVLALGMNTHKLTLTVYYI